MMDGNIRPEAVHLLALKEVKSESPSTQSQMLSAPLYYSRVLRETDVFKSHSTENEMLYALFSLYVSWLCKVRSLWVVQFQDEMLLTVLYMSISVIQRREVHRCRSTQSQMLSAVLSVCVSLALEEVSPLSLIQFKMKGFLQPLKMSESLILFSIPLCSFDTWLTCVLHELKHSCIMWC